MKYAGTLIFVAVVLFLGSGGRLSCKAEEPTVGVANQWQQKSIEYARIMSQVRWTPVANTMPRRGGYFTAGEQYTGVPYSSVKHVGRYIGFDIYLKTFLAAVENPKSVLYSENLYGKVKNAECFYGKVCSSYTSYALQCGIWYVSKLHGPKFRDGVERVEPQAASAANPGDVIYTPPARKGGGSHIELVTDVIRDDQGVVTHVRVEESRPQTTRDTLRTVKEFNSHLASRNRELFHIVDLDAWRGENRAESFLFPNYEEDSATPQINRVLLLDLGDWVVYHKGQPVKINVMDRENRGVRALIIQRGQTLVERIKLTGTGVVKRAFDQCGDYTVHCEMVDGSRSQACEFAVSELDFQLPEKPLKRGQPWDIKLNTDNMDAVIVYFKNSSSGYDEHNVFVTDDDRRVGKVRVPASVTEKADKMQVWVIGENRYGRLKKRQFIQVVGEPGAK